MYISIEKHIKGKKMNCLKCASITLRTISTIQDGAVTKRVKMCRKCSFIFHTIETPCFKDYPTKEEVNEYEAYIDEELNKSQ